MMSDSGMSNALYRQGTPYQNPLYQVVLVVGGLKVA